MGRVTEARQFQNVTYNFASRLVARCGARRADAPTRTRGTVRLAARVTSRQRAESSRRAVASNGRRIGPPAGSRAGCVEGVAHRLIGWPDAMPRRAYPESVGVPDTEATFRPRGNSPRARRSGSATLTTPCPLRMQPPPRSRCPRHHRLGRRALDDPNVRFLEVDVDTEAYDTGHLPGHRLELDEPAHRSGPPRPRQPRGPRAAPERGRRDDDTTIVLYGDNNNWFAAWAYWQLELLRASTTSGSSTAAAQGLGRRGLPS